MKKNFTIIKKAISKEKAEFLNQYFLLKRKVSRTYFDTGFISQFNKEYGIWNDPQCLGAWSHYGDIAGDLILTDIKPLLEKYFKKKLHETYSYVRVYEKGHELKRHKDRESCQYSVTLNLGGTPWPIYIENNPKLGFWASTKPGSKGNISIKKENDYYSELTKGSKVILKPGDVLIYRGDLCEHWREPLSSGLCTQLFLHYVDQKGVYKDFKFDKRPFLGLDRTFYAKEAING